MTAVRSFVSKATIQAVLALILVLLVCYGFVSRQVSGEAVIGLVSMAMAYYFKGSPAAEK